MSSQSVGSWSISLIEKQINGELDLDMKDDKKETSLMHIITYIHHFRDYGLKLANSLIEKGCNLNSKGSHSSPVLIRCARKIGSANTDYLNLFKLIIKNDKCDLNIIHNHMNALHILCDFVSLETSSVAIKLLIEKERCDLNIRGYAGDTPLMILMKNFSTSALFEIFELFIEDERCDLNIKSNGETAFYCACEWKQPSFIIKQFLNSKRFILDESVIYPNYENLIIDHFTRKRNKIGTFLMFIKKKSRLDIQRKKAISRMEDNPLEILPRELIHLILSYSHPLAPQTKYTRRK